MSVRKPKSLIAAETRNEKQEIIMERYIVINQYGIGGEKGEVMYRPRCTGGESERRCERWVRRNDSAHTARIDSEEVAL
jgi:hypothetical protein